MDTAEGSDLDKVQARRAKHKARGINGNGFGESLSEKAQVSTLEWMAPRVARGGYTRDKGDPEKQRATLEGQATEWRAPMAGDSKRGATSTRGGNSEYQDKAGQHSLVTQASKWVAPLAADSGEKITMASHQVSLMRQAQSWPGPQARDYRSAEKQQSEHDLWGTKGLPLEQVAVHLFRPPLFQDQATSLDGENSSPAIPNSSPPSPKRKLNPFFVEALMRWPTGLSGFERQATAWTRWWQLQLSYVSQLVSASSTESPQQDLFG